MCGQDVEPDEQPLADGVTVFCCERCSTGVLRTFAYHDRSEPPAPSGRTERAS